MLYPFSRDFLRDPRRSMPLDADAMRVYSLLEAQVEQFRKTRGPSSMRYEEMIKKSLDELMEPMLKRMTPERIAKVFTPEQLVKALTPEQLVKALTPDQIASLLQAQARPAKARSAKARPAKARPATARPKAKRRSAAARSH
jgi:hypothetical protein